ncbi:MAG: M20/M25/M40 family metallo-hydrolase [Chloroflexi bacterium]|nr:M20/M25/M40 family metallo-hydrolase [Chloroflexota bacterium]
MAAQGSPQASRPSDARSAEAWARAHERLVETLRELIRIPSVNPPDPPGPELDAARAIAARLEASGVPATVYEPVPGRGSVVARLRGDGTGGDPLLLLSHLDVVPAPPDRWTHDPFAGDVEDGYLYGRGAVDMKDLVAMELEVVRGLAERAAAAGLDPALHPIPGLRRDILFAVTADEEAGGHAGIGWIVEHHPEHLRAAGAINESGGVSLEVGGVRLYPIQVAEKGYCVYRIAIRGTWGHGSMPRPDNAAVLAAEAIRRLSVPGPARLTPVMARFFEAAAEALPGDAATLLRAMAGGDAGRAEAAIDQRCAPVYARAARALVRDTISPNVIHAGVKYNVIPGEAVIELDCRHLPGTDEPAIRADIEARLGPELLAACRIELVTTAPPVVADHESPLYEILAQAIRDHDPDGVPLPVMAPFATDAKHLLRLGVPAYGFSPLRLEATETYLDRYHGVDERVSLEGLRWGLPVLWDAVLRFCG